jgi:3-hydroxyacyl-CoA dehydrogenase
MGPFELMDPTGRHAFAAATGSGGPRPSRPASAVVHPGSHGRDGAWGGRPVEASTSTRTASALGECRAAGRHPRRSNSPAQIRDRILDAIATEARFAADEGVATPDVIDIAPKVSGRAPAWPFESRRAPS